MAPFKLPALPDARVTRIFLAVVLVTSSCLGGLTSFLIVRGAVFPWTAGESMPSGLAGATLAVNALGTPMPAAPNPNLPASLPALSPWDGAGRVTVLIMGLDYRDWQANEGPSRTDTMILLTLDPQTKTAGMLSIPRDMWVAIPGFKHGKINTAYFLGEAYKLPGGGPGLAVKTVEQFLGVPINYYAQIDFGTFVKFIDEIGGVKVDIPAKIKVDLVNGGVKNLKPGSQVLPGEWALAYARNRYTEGGDFDRAQRQQQVIMGIRDRVLSVHMLPTLISRAPALYNELSAGIHTNLTLDQAVQLAVLAQQVPETNIKKGIFGKDYTLFGQSPDKLSILIPIPDKIHVLRDEIFASSGALGPATPGNAQEQMKAEAARVAVLNGSRSTDLAARTAEALRRQEMNISSTGNASSPSGVTLIIDHTGNPYTVRYLMDLFKLGEDNVAIRFDPNNQADVELVLGNDAVNKPLP